MHYKTTDNKLAICNLLANTTAQFQNTATIFEDRGTETCAAINPTPITDLKSGNTSVRCGFMLPDRFFPFTATTKTNGKNGLARLQRASRVDYDLKIKRT